LNPILPVLRTVSVSDAATVTEPATGIAQSQFLVTLRGPLLQPGQVVKVAFSTQNGSAIGSPTGVGGDYKTLSGSLSFVSGGPTSKIVQVAVTGDGVNDGAGHELETFTLHLTAIHGAQIHDGVGLGRIVDLQQSETPDPDPDPGPGTPCKVADVLDLGPIIDCVPGPIVEN
jgi:hypothetical protein